MVAVFILPVKDAAEREHHSCLCCGEKAVGGEREPDREREREREREKERERERE